MPAGRSPAPPCEPVRSEERAALSGEGDLGHDYYHLHSLNERESEDAVRKPVEDAACPVRLFDDSVQTIVETSGGYPYFLQFVVPLPGRFISRQVAAH
jgi:hypothetical protein